MSRIIAQVERLDQNLTILQRAKIIGLQDPCRFIPFTFKDRKVNWFVR